MLLAVVRAGEGEPLVGALGQIRLVLTLQILGEFFINDLAVLVEGALVWIRVVRVLLVVCFVLRVILAPLVPI